jgi:peptidoglycan/xylan/chitin deacetylase (PgdA/CDA1 family)
MPISPVRFDRFATLYLAQPLMSAGLRSTSRHLPILMYHSVSNAEESGMSPYYRTSTRPDIFQAQMRVLRDSGWKGVTLSDGLKSLSDGNGLLEKKVAITFDDGFEDFQSNAAGPLRECGFKATMYLPSGFIADTHTVFKNNRCLSWRQIVDLHSEGMEFGSHTVSHPKLVDLPWSKIRIELIDSKRAIEDKIGAAVLSFAYPFAFPQQDAPFTARFRQELQSAGYKSCVTTAIGRVAPTDDPFTLKRLPANSCDDSDLLNAKLNGAYDWLAWPQAAYKQCRQWMKPNRAPVSA